MGATPKLPAGDRRLVRAKSPAWLWDKDSSTANSFTCQEQNARESISKHLLAGFSGKSVVESVAILESRRSSSCVSAAAGRGGDVLTQDLIQLQPKFQSL